MFIRLILLLLVCFGGSSYGMTLIERMVVKVINAGYQNLALGAGIGTGISLVGIQFAIAMSFGPLWFFCGVFFMILGFAAHEKWFCLRRKLPTQSGETK